MLDRTPHALTVDARLAALPGSVSRYLVERALAAGAEQAAADMLDRLESRIARRAA
jgi:hypothetical protein